MDPATVGQFAELFSGREDAWGTGKGAVVRGSLRESHYASHLEGHAPGLGIFPLLDDGTVRFAAVDLDEPDFEAAQMIQSLLPGNTFIEQSRSGNFHIWAFFSEPIEAWVPRALMKHAAAGVGKEGVEVFPKQDRLAAGMVGNYINLPYHGEERKIVHFPTVDTFLRFVKRNDPKTWRLRAATMGLSPQAMKGSGREQGSKANLHICAEKIIHESATGENPVRAGHRHVVMFNLAKMLLDWNAIDDNEAWDMLAQVNSESPDPLPPRVLAQTFNNAKRGGYTSTGCDNPVMVPYTHPDCPIAHGPSAR